MSKRALTVTAAAAVLATSLLFGSAVAANPLVLIALPGLALLALVVFGDDRWALSMIFLLRTLSDTTFLGPDRAFAVNVGISALSMLLLCRYVFLERVPLGRIAVAVLVFVGIFTAVGIGVYGIQTSMLNESLRIVSIVAIGASAAAAVAKWGGRSIANPIVFAALPSAALTFAGWVLQIPGLYSEDTGRGFGTLTHPVAAAGFFSLVAVLALYAALHYGLWVHLGSLGVLTLAVIATSSLAGLASIAFGLITLLALLRRGTPGRLVAIVGVGVGGLAALAAFGSTIFARLEELGSSTSAVEAASGENSLDWRFRNWDALLEYWEQNPALGWGFGSTNDLIRPLGELPHSGPVRILVESGVLGLVLAGGILVAALVVTARMWRNGHRNEAALRLTIVTTTVVNSLSSNTMGYMPLLMALGVAWAIAQPESEARRLVPGGRRAAPAHEDRGGPAGSREAGRSVAPEARYGRPSPK